MPNPTTVADLLQMRRQMMILSDSTSGSDSWSDSSWGDSDDDAKQPKVVAAGASSSPAAANAGPPAVSFAFRPRQPAGGASSLRLPSETAAAEKEQNTTTFSSQNPARERFSEVLRRSTHNAHQSEAAPKDSTKDGKGEDDSAGDAKTTTTRKAPENDGRKEGGEGSSSSSFSPSSNSNSNSNSSNALPWDLLSVDHDERTPSVEPLEEGGEGQGQEGEILLPVPAGRREVVGLEGSGGGESLSVPPPNRLAASALVDVVGARSARKSELLGQSAVSETSGRQTQQASSGRGLGQTIQQRSEAEVRRQRDREVLSARDTELLLRAREPAHLLRAGEMHAQLLRWLQDARMYRAMIPAAKDHFPSIKDHFELTDYSLLAMEQYHRCLTLLRLLQMKAQDSVQPPDTAANTGKHTDHLAHDSEDQYHYVGSPNVLKEFAVTCFTETAGVQVDMGNLHAAIPLLVEAVNTSLSTAEHVGAVSLLSNTLESLLKVLTSSNVNILIEARCLDLPIVPEIEDSLLQLASLASKTYRQQLTISCATDLVTWLADRCDAMSMMHQTVSASAQNSEEGAVSEKAESPVQQYVALLGEFLEHSNQTIRDLANRHMKSLGDYMVEIRQVDSVFAEHTAAHDEFAAAPRSDEDTVKLRVFSDKLSGASPYFAALFASAMKETVERTVVLEVDDPSVCVGIIEYCYTSREPEWSDETAVEYLTLSHKFQLSDLKSKAENFVVSRWQVIDVAETCTVDEVADLIDIAKATECPTLTRLAQNSLFDFFFVPAIDKGDGITAEYITENFPDVAGRLSASEISQKVFEAIDGENKSESSALFLLSITDMLSSVRAEDETSTAGNFGLLDDILDQIAHNAPRTSGAFGANSPIAGMCGECGVTDGHLTSCSKFRRAGQASGAGASASSTTSNSATPWSSNPWANPSPAPPPPAAASFTGASTGKTHGPPPSRAHLVGLAFSNGMMRVVRKLIELDAGLVNEGAPTLSPLALAVRFEHDELFEWLSQHAGLHPRAAAHYSCLSDAVALGRVDYVKSLLKSRVGAGITVSLDSENYVPYCEPTLFGLPTNNEEAVGGDTGGAASDEGIPDASGIELATPSARAGPKSSHLRSAAKSLLSPLQVQEMPISPLTLAVLHRKPNAEIISMIAADPWGSIFLNDSHTQAVTPLIAATAAGRDDLCELLISPISAADLEKEAEGTKEADTPSKVEDDSPSGGKAEASDDDAELAPPTDLAVSGLSVEEALGKLPASPLCQQVKQGVPCCCFSCTPAAPEPESCDVGLLFRVWAQPVGDNEHGWEVLSALHMAAALGNAKLCRRYLRILQREAKSGAGPREHDVAGSALSEAKGDRVKKVFAKFGFSEPGPPIHADALAPPPPLIVPDMPSGSGVSRYSMHQLAYGQTDSVLAGPPKRKHTIWKMRGKRRRFRTCDVCETKIVGLFHAGHRCNDCDAVCHDKCISLFQLANDCPGNAMDYVPIIRTN